MVVTPSNMVNLHKIVAGSQDIPVPCSTSCGALVLKTNGHSHASKLSALVHTRLRLIWSNAYIHNGCWYLQLTTTNKIHNGAHVVGSKVMFDIDSSLVTGGSI